MKKGNEIFCNKCGKKRKVQNEIPVEDFVSVQKTWGFFSDKDGVAHEFDLCEECYDEFVRQFCIPVEETEVKEML